MFCHILLLLSLALPSLLTLDSCPAIPGMPGFPGFPGRDGRDGLKGEKGEPGFARSDEGSFRGTKGERGVEGPVGKRGQSGNPGEKGLPGMPGILGAQGDPGEGGLPEKAAFSVARGTNDIPDRNSVIRFKKVITNLHDDYNTTSGRFRCRIPGVYYFVYHASIDDNLCVNMKLEETVLASFCDHRRKRRQVTSGGLAVSLSDGQEVWLETVDYRGMRGSESGYSVFSGFLLQAH